MRFVKVAGICLAVAGGGAASNAAQAQSMDNALRAATNQAGRGVFDRDRSISVSNRRREGYEAAGIRYGAFVVSPTAAALATHTDNVYATPSEQQADTYYTLAPNLTITSDWSRHVLQLTANADLTRYQEFTTENTEGFLIGAAGRVDVTRQTIIDVQASAARRSEPRSSTTSPLDAAQPVQYDAYSLGISGARTSGSLRLSGRASSVQADYDDVLARSGAALDQDFRDRTTTVGAVRIDYALSPSAALFIETTGNIRRYRASSDRDSDGYQAIVGTNFEFTQLLRGEVGIGYLNQSYKDPSINTTSGFSYRGELEWFPTGLTTLSVAAARTINESTFMSSTGFTSNTLSATAEHELLRNLILKTQINLANDDYLGLDRQDDRLGVNMSATYLLNRGLVAEVAYAHLKQESTYPLPDLEYELNTLTFGLTFRY